MSANTGRAPARHTEPAVAKNVYAGTMTSSAGPSSRGERHIPSAMSETSSASVPLDTPTACFTPEYLATASSKSATYFPPMKYWLSSTSRIDFSVSERTSAYCFLRSKRGIFISSEFKIYNAGNGNPYLRIKSRAPNEKNLDKKFFKPKMKTLRRLRMRG